MSRTGLSSGTVFIVDDDESVQRGLERLMRSAGFTVEGYSSARQFLNRLPYEGIGCTLLDVAMPDMTGPELQEHMLALGVSLPIVYLTGQADVPIVISAMKNGALDILLKPVDEECLLNTVHAAIERHASSIASTQKHLEITQRLARLSRREREVMEMVIHGRLNKQIAGEYGIAEKTVKAQRASMMRKLEIRSVAELVQLCIAAGIVPRSI